MTWLRSLLGIILHLLRRALIAVLCLQGVIIVVLMAVDAIRKRRDATAVTFPRRDPEKIEVAGTEATTFTYGEDLYSDMVAAIAAAEHQVLFETFIWKNDEVGEEFKDALIAAASRGVDVYVIYDGFANLVVDPRFFQFPDTLHVLRFPVLRPSGMLLDPRKSGRDHRKILVIDGRIGYVGGYNIGSLYATQWRDTHLKLVGPSVWELENAFVDFWNMQRTGDLPELDDHGTHTWEPRIRAFRNVPGQLVYPIRGMYLEAIDRAVDHIYMTQAYFIPDRDILHALLRAAKRGVDVRVLVPELSNHVVADWLARGFYETLLSGGVRMLMYQDAMVHAKTATIDGMWSTVGTANIDRLSLGGNYEINVEITDADFAAKLERIFETDSTNAHELTLDEWHRRPWVAKFSEAVLAPLRPLL